MSQKNETPIDGWGRSYGRSGRSEGSPIVPDSGVPFQGKNPRLDVDRIRHAAEGQWGRILPALGLEPKFLSNKHGPCPFCGGTDRFRLDDRNGSGSFFCSQCGPGDGFSMAARLLSHGQQDFPKTLGAIADVIGIVDDLQPAKNHSSPKAAPRHPESLPDRAAQAAEKASIVWRASTPAREDHGYLQRKGVQATETLKEICLDKLVEIIGYRPKGKSGPFQGETVLVAPIRVGDELTSLSLVDPDGRKHFLAGGQLKGGYWSTQPLPGGDLPGLWFLIGEGIGTCLSACHAVPGAVGVSAMMNSNLPAVSQFLRGRFPRAKITLLADVEKKSGAPDKFAVQSAMAIGGFLVIPDFGEARQEKDTDINDVHRLFGLEKVRLSIELARIVKAVAEARPGPILGGHSGMNVMSGNLPNHGVGYRRMAEVQAEPVQWLWPGRIAKKKLTLQAGDPGLGKSQIGLYQAAVVSTGGLWPDGSQCSRPGNVVIISVEDDPSDTIKPRLEACGADMNKIFILEAIHDVDSQGRKRKRGFNLQEDLGRLETMIDQIGGADLILVDPVSAYVGRTDSYKNSDVRALLAPLSDLASRRECAVVAVSHLAKSGSSAMTKISGSLGFIAAARAGYLIVKDPIDKEKRLFLPVKNNIGIDQTGFAFRIQSVELPSGIQTSKIGWEADQISTTADEALAAQCSNQEERSQLDEAKEFLVDQLKNGPIDVQKIKTESRGAGVSEITLRRAKTALKIKPRKEPISGRWKWALPPSSDEKRGTANQDAHPPTHDHLDHLDHLDQHASHTSYKNNINNNNPRIPSIGKLIEGDQGDQHAHDDRGWGDEHLGQIDLENNGEIF
ncbi:MAG: AAA family ATPase [Magnetococcales bacterium]|nr:AAA family ATPase [Magnetococcales bacterium]